MIRSDEFYMHRAMDQAHLAFTNGEVPVGAVVVDTQGEIIGAGHNAPLASCDPSGHAEVRALREAGQRSALFDLEGQPCVLLQPRHQRVTHRCCRRPQPSRSQIGIDQ